MPKSSRSELHDFINVWRTKIDPAFRSTTDTHELVFASLTSDSAKEKVLSLRDELAISCMEEILRILEGLGSESSQLRLGHDYRFQLRRLLVQLSKVSGRIPDSIFAKGVERSEGLFLFPTAGGGYADIFHMTFQGIPVALKRLRIFSSSTSQEDLHRDICREALVWQQLRHPFILPLLGMDRETFKPYYCLVSPWMHLGSLIQHIQDELRSSRAQPLPLERWLTEIAEGMQYLHSEGIVHGDLRGANILVGNDTRVRLTDFGLAHFAGSTSASMDSRVGGSVRWVAPEILKLENAKPSFQSDIYAFGCVFIEIYTRRHPFHDIQLDFQVIAKKLMGARPMWPSESASNRLHLVLSDWEFIKSCWNDEPNRRPDGNALASACLSRYKGLKLIPLSLMDLPQYSALYTTQSLAEQSLDGATFDLLEVNQYMQEATSTAAEQSPGATDSGRSGPFSVISGFSSPFSSMVDFSSAGSVVMI